MSKTGYYNDSDCDIGAFRALIKQQTKLETLLYACDVRGNLPIYEVADLQSVLASDSRLKLLAEWTQVLAEGAGALVLRGLISDTQVIDQASEIFLQIIDAESQAELGEGDHFAAAGNNARIWNSAQKLCLHSPRVFAQYFANPTLAAIAEAWLGPGYQMTAQVNLVRPGGLAQKAHRDFHLGFQSTERMQAYPIHVHALSPALTLQGAIAHCEMSLESGPTKLLPYSQGFGAGYLAMTRPEFQEAFETNQVQLPLAKGDGLFFNPALFHAAGQNVSSNIERLANLLQVSSAFGRAMESLDREAMSIALFPELRHLESQMSALEIDSAIAACAEAYPFPTNLDQDPPLNGMAPESQADLMRRALHNNFSINQFKQALRQQTGRRHS